MNIIQGSDAVGSYEAVSISLGISKKENRDGIKAKFAVFQYESCFSGRAKPIRDIMFEDQLGAARFELLRKYVKKDDEGKELKDAKGGYVVDIDAIYAAAEAGGRAEKKIIQRLIEVPGGCVRPYKLHGERYANDVDGNPVKKKDGTRVKKSVIRVFVQVINIHDGDDGKPVTEYVDGISPEVKGAELEDRFYREVVPTATVAPAEAAEVENDDVF